jgi:hypothetical protein
MRIRLIHITTRKSGKARRELSLEAERLRVGRGTENELTLNALTVSLQHASFHERGGQIFVEPAEGSEVLVNGGRTVGELRVGPGDVVRVGPFELRLVAGEGEDLSLEVEESERRGSEEDELRKRTRIGLEGGWLTRRSLSWTLVLGVLAVFLAIPLGSGRQSSWNSGSISRSHAFIANDCSACHSGFERVTNASCLACHVEIENHARADASPGSLDGARCASCHIEHNGSGGLAELDAPLCESCHGDLSDLAADTQLEDSSDFGDRHPDFRLYMVADLATRRVEPVTWKPGLEERSGVRFSHLRHVGQVLPLPDGGKQNLQCDACHVLDAGGQYMQPVSFEEHCQSCHQLGFDEVEGTREALHGAPAEMRVDLAEFYSQLALRGEVKSERAPPLTRFRRPGQVLTEEERRVVFDWVEEKVAEAERALFEEPGECARCHPVLPGAAPDGGIDVEPVAIAEVWMPKSEFRHETHGPFECRRCHPAVAVFDPDYAENQERPSWSLPGAIPYALSTPEELRREHGLEASEKASDVSILGIGSCRDCHGGARDGPPLVASACVMCHPFHRDEHGPMRERQGVHTASRFEVPFGSQASVDSRAEVAAGHGWWELALRGQQEEQGDGS